MPSQEKLGVCMNGRERRLQLVGCLQHMSRPLFRGGDQASIDSGELFIALSQGVGQSGGQIPHRQGHERNGTELPRRDPPGNEARIRWHGAREHRPRHYRPRALQGETGKVHPDGRESHTQALCIGEKDARQHNVEEVRFGFAKSCAP